MHRGPVLWARLLLTQMERAADAVRMTRFLGLGPKDNVVTIATDGFDRYPSVLADLERRKGRYPHVRFYPLPFIL